MRVTAEQLLRNTKAMASKVGGADSWEARDLAKLPIGWWELASAIWNKAIEQGKLPKAWCKAKVVLIWKKQARTRPISLFSILWRSGARALACNMRPWCETWQSHYDTGGLPAASKRKSSDLCLFSLFLCLFICPPLGGSVKLLCLEKGISWSNKETLAENVSMLAGKHVGLGTNIVKQENKK